MIKLNTILIVLILQVSLCSLRIVDERYSARRNRAIGGESLDTSNFVLYIDSNNSRFIEVPQEYMKNWIDDHKMWRTWSVTLAMLCIVFFGIFLFSLIYGFISLTGPFSTCIKYNYNRNDSHDKILSSETTIPIDYQTRYDNSSRLPQAVLTSPRHISAL